MYCVMSGGSGVSENLQFPICACQGQASREDKSLYCVVSNKCTEHPCLLLQPWERCSTPGCSWWGAVSWGRSKEKTGSPGTGQPSGWGDAGCESAMCAGSSPGEGEWGTGMWPEGSRVCVFFFWCVRMALETCEMQLFFLMLKEQVDKLLSGKCCLTPFPPVISLVKLQCGGIKW